MRKIGRARIALLLIVLASLPGCSTLAESYRTDIAGPSTGASKIAGSAYSLPKAHIRVGVIRDAFGIAVVVGQPKFVPDATASYVLSHRPSGTSADKLEIAIEGGLLTGINGEADDQSAAILEAIGKLLIGVPELAYDKESAPEILFAYTFDPNDSAMRTEVEGWLNQAIQTMVPTALDRDCNDAISKALAVELPTEIAARIAKERQLVSHTRKSTPACRVAAVRMPTLSLEFDYTPFKFGAGFPVAPCTVGICTRKLNPAIITFRANGIPFASDSFLIPNGSDAVPYALIRTTFAKTTHTIVLKDGSITSADVNKGSEFLAIANTPFNIIKGAVTTAAELVQLRINLTGKNKELADAQKQLLDSQEALKSAQKLAVDQNKPETSMSASTAMIFAYLPGLGPGSGAGQLNIPGIANEGEQTKGATATKQLSGQKQSAQQQGDAADGVDAGSVLGTTVQGGNDGTKPTK
ncbi:MAG: hypothetical protein KF899_15345 [Parvibaculum sp.]|nr:hypothetical protein [Parvibaculum sp.]